MASRSVADRVSHRLPRPIKCDNCGGPKVHLQKRSLMKMRVFGNWDLVWHCLDCLALVGCHEGTDVPLGRMADATTRAARFEAHRAFDPLWQRGGKWARAEAYVWLANVLHIPPEDAHIGMLSVEQCEALMEAITNLRNHPRSPKGQAPHWKQRERKKRRK